MRRIARLTPVFAALALFASALSCRNPTSREYFQDGLVSAARGDSFLAVRQFTRALARDPSLAAAYDARGRIFLNTGRFGRALLDFRTAAGFDSLNSDLFFDIGDAEQRLGNHRLAIENFRRSARLNPARRDVYARCGTSYAALGEYDAAIDDLDLVIAGDTSSSALADAYYRRGALWERLGDDELAIRDVSQSLKIRPDNAEAQADLGFAYLAVGRKAEARALFTAALENYAALPDRGRRVIEALNENWE